MLNTKGTRQFPKCRRPVLIERPSGSPAIPVQADGSAGGACTFWHSQTPSTSSRWLVSQLILTVSLQVCQAPVRGSTTLVSLTPCSWLAWHFRVQTATQCKTSKMLGELTWLEIISGQSSKKVLGLGLWAFRSLLIIRKAITLDPSILLETLDFIRAHQPHQWSVPVKMCKFFTE